MVDFKALETLVWVAALGSFRRAAEKLSTTQPAVSHRIAQLEDELGGKLLTRKKHNVAPTYLGRQVLVFAEKMLAMRAEMLSSIRADSTLQGTMRLGVAETIVHTWLPRFIQELNREYPHLSVEIEVDTSPVLREKLLAQEVDIAFLLGPLTAPLLRNRSLCDYRVGFIASPTLGLPNPATVHDLARVPLITFARKTQPYEAVRSIFNRSDIPPINLHASASLATMMHLAAEGFGVAVIPHELVAEELARGRLELIETEIKMPQLSFCASWLDAPDSLSVALVVDIAVSVAELRLTTTGRRAPADGVGQTEVSD